MTRSPAGASGGRKGTEPQRRCLASGLVLPKEQLVRFVVGPDDALVPDLAERLPGRGLWLQARQDMMAKACARNLFAKAAKRHVRVPDDLPVQVERLALQRCLSLLGLASEGRNVKLYDQAAGVCQKVLAKNPEHPGALHYLIHAYDDPERAYKGLDAAEKYGKVAPDSEHALHMPSHIYVAMGMWDKMVKANELSWEAAEKSGGMIAVFASRKHA